MASKDKNQRRKKSQQAARDRMAIQRGEDPGKARKKRNKKKAREKEPLGMSLSMFLGILVIILVLARGYSVNGDLLVTNKADLGETTQGVVTSLESGGVFARDLEYPVFEYTVGEKTYTHKSYVASGGANDDEMLHFIKGNTVTIYYDAADPERAFSKMELENKGRVVTGYVAVVGIIILVMISSIIIGRLTSRSQQVLRNKN